MNKVITNINNMTKAEIIQRILEEKHITVEEAMTLMTHDSIPMPVYNPYTPPFRVGNVDWTWDPNRGPWYTYQTSTTSKPIFETSDNSDV